MVVTIVTCKKLKHEDWSVDGYSCYSLPLITPGARIAERSLIGGENAQRNAGLIFSSVSLCAPSAG